MFCQVAMPLLDAKVQRICELLLTLRDYIPHSADHPSGCTHGIPVFSRRENPFAMVMMTILVLPSNADRCKLADVCAALNFAVIGSFDANQLLASRHWTCNRY